MANLSPKELDQIFREGSEQYSFEYNEAAWEHMEGLLEEEDRRRLLWWILGGLSVILFFGTVYFLLPIKQDDLKKTQVQNSTLNKEISLLPKSQNKELKQTPLSISENIEEESKANKHEINLKTGEAIPKLNNSFTKNKKRPFFIKNDEVISDTNPSVEDQSNNDNSFVFTDTLIPMVVPLTMLEILAKQYSHTNTSEVHNLIIEAKIVEPENEEDNLFQDSTKKNSLVIGLVTAAEVSTIGRDNICRPDFKIGAQLEYRFSKRLATSAGLNFIRKDYGAGQGEYTPPMGFWTDGVVPQTTRGLCDIIEVPMNFSYFLNNFSDERKNNFYVTGGITSYIMLRSEYNYFYGEDPPSPDLIKEWQEANGRDNLFGVGHVSIGVERFLNKKNSIQIAPYVQIPLQEIGHGRVKIWSFGVTGKFNFHL